MQQSKELKVIVNADDFGMNTSINRAVIKSFENGWVSSATIMANMPTFGEACELARETGVHDRIGLHFNITSGRPLTHPIKKNSRFCDSDGLFIFSIYKGMHLTKDDKVVLADELEAQWNVCLASGFTPTHLDSHGHIHTGWGIASVIIKMAQPLDIRAVRIHWNVVPPKSVLKRAYYTAINARYRYAGLAATAYGAQATQGALAIQKGWTPVEIMVHPDLGSDGTVIDYVVGTPLRDIFDGFGLTGTPISYREILATT